MALFLAYVSYSVERLAEGATLDVDLSSLRASIGALHDASAALDKEKEDAERELVRLARRIARRKAIKRRLREAWCKLRKILHKPCEEDLRDDLRKYRYIPSFTRSEMHKREDGDLKVRPRLGLAPARMREKREQKRRELDSPGPRGCHSRKARDEEDKRLQQKFMRAAKRVRAVNAKLAGFERGFIHPDGIKDREWYRHLGVAPGKWLGECSVCLVRR